MRARLGSVCGLALAALLNTRCDWLDDRLQTCGDMRIDLLNSQQTTSSISILADEESPFPEAVLASGATRRIVMCVERGDAKRFRAWRAEETLAIANCVVSRGRYEYEATVARVVWDQRGLSCENW